MRVLVTGATGFIGTVLCHQLHECGISVETVTRSPNDSCPGPTPGGWTIPWPEGLARIDYSSYAAVVHLAIPPTRDAGIDSCALQTAAMHRLIEGMAASAPRCTLVFVSSQSATAAARSGYARGKWHCEQLLRSSTIPHVIVRPGLVVSRGPPAGLFGRIATIVRWLPVIAVPHASHLRVQPILVEDVAALVTQVVADATRLSRTTIDIALPPRSLPELVNDICWELRLRRVVVPIPLAVAGLPLRLLGRLLPGLRLSDHLEGLEGGSPIDPQEAERVTGVRLLPFGVPRANWAASERIAWEAVLLSRHFFGLDPSRRMIHRYTDAHGVLTQLSAAPPRSIRPGAVSGWMAEAVERVGRSPTHPLTAKFHVLCSLAELEPAFRTSFRTDKPRPLAGWLSLALHTAALPLIMAAGWLSRAIRQVGSSSPRASQHE